MKKVFILFVFFALINLHLNLFSAAIECRNKVGKILSENKGTNKLIRQVNNALSTKDKNASVLVNKLMLLTEDKYEYVLQKISIPDKLKQAFRERVDSEALKTDLQCPICLARLIPGQNKYSKKEAFKCDHMYHKDCINDWLKMNPEKNHCPYCKAQPKEQRSFFLLAISEGVIGVVRSFIENGADVNHVDFNSIKPLMLAVRYGNEEVARLLIDSGADVNYADASGCSPLIWAARYGYAALAKDLLDSGANIEHLDVLGDSALIVASSYGHEAVVRVLLYFGADVNYENGYGVNALSSASDNGHAEIADLLIANGAIDDDILKARVLCGLFGLMVYKFSCL